MYLSTGHAALGRWWGESSSNNTRVPGTEMWLFGEVDSILQGWGYRVQAVLANTLSCLLETLPFMMRDLLVSWATNTDFYRECMVIGF